MSAQEQMVEVRLLGLPLGEYVLAQQHYDGLVREFTLIALDDAESVPRRLLALVDEFQERFSTFTAAARQEMADAIDRGEETIDVAFLVPPAAGEVSRRMLRLLDEADDFCRQGELLTMAAPPEAVAFRRWYLGQLADQSEGRAPASWSQRPSTLPTS